MSGRGPGTSRKTSFRSNIPRGDDLLLGRALVAVTAISGCCRSQFCVVRFPGERFRGYGSLFPTSASPLGAMGGVAPLRVWIAAQLNSTEVCGGWKREGKELTEYSLN